MHSRFVFFLVLAMVFEILPCLGQLEFIENSGQWPVSYSLRARMKHGDLWLSGNKMAMVLSDFGIGPKPDPDHPHGNPEMAKNHCYTMEFIGASASVVLKGEDKKSHYHNYYIGKNPSEWKSNVSLYGRALHKEIYPGIDLIWKEEKGNLKYEFNLSPGSNPKQILIQYSGLEQKRIKNGRLELNTSLGIVTENKPVAWQNDGPRKIPVLCSFDLKPDGKVGFRFPNGYNPRLPLVIDPVLVFSTFSGSRADNWGFTATYGENEIAYAGGIALGPRFPITTGAFSDQFGGDSTNFNGYSTFDIGILKFSSDGSQLLFATYLGGSEAESPASMVVDQQDHLIVLGTTSSSNFPVTNGCYDPSFNGGSSISPYTPGDNFVRYRTGSDLILARFSPDGTQLSGSTFMGGSGNDGILPPQSGNSSLVKNYGDSFRGEVALDSLGNIYVASHTQSTDFPVLQPLQAQKSGGIDGVCFRLNSALTSLQFSTFLGGAGNDGAFSLQVGEQGRVYLAGGTNSSNFPTTSGVLNPSFGGTIDGFVCSFIPGQGLPSFRSTYIGTSAYDQAYFVQRDAKKNVYVYGQTLGSYPVSQNVYANPGSSQFIHCLSPNLDSTRFSTVFGNGTATTNITPTAFLVDECGRIYCSGWGGITNSGGVYQNGNTQNLPTTPGAYCRNSDGSDFYFIVLEKNAQNLSFATYFGDTLNFSQGDHVDGGTSRFDKKGIVYQSVCAGCGGSSSFPTTPGVFSNTNRSSNCNNALFKYDFSLLDARYQPSVIQGCAPLDVTFLSQSVFATQYKWDFGTGSPVFTTQDTISFRFDSAGTYPVKLVAINPEACPGTDSVFRTIVVQDVPKIPGDSLRFCSLSDTLTLPSLPDGNFQWSWEPATYLNSTTQRNVQVMAPQETTVFTGTTTSTFGCQRKTRFKVSNGILKARGLADTLKGCRPLNLSFTSQSFQARNLRWYFGDGDSSTLLAPDQMQPHTFSLAGDFNVILKVLNDTTCLSESTDTLRVRVFELPAERDTLNRFCEEGSVTLKAPRNEGVRFSWSPGNLLSDSTLESPVVISAAPSIFKVLISDSNQCRSVSTVDLRDGRLKAVLNLTTPSFCTPLEISMVNSSLNTQKSRFIWAGDSVETVGAPSLPLLINDSGRTRIRLKVFSDTACKTMDETTAFIDLGGIKPVPQQSIRYCPGDSVRLQAIQSPGFLYIWPPSDDALPQSYKTILPGPDSLLVTIGLQDSFGCSGTQTWSLIPTKPQAEFSGTSEFDPCFDYLNYRLDANPLAGAAFQWRIEGVGNFTGNPLPIRFPERRKFGIQLVVNQNQCRDTLWKELEVNDKQLILKSSFELLKRYSDCSQPPGLEIRNQSKGADRYLWSWNEGVSNNEVPRIPLDGISKLQISLTAYNGLCSDELTQEVELFPIQVPNLLTANQDGKNEALIIRNLPEDTRLEIRDRWGKKVFESARYENNWIPPRDFYTGFFELTLPDGNACRSWVQVVR